MRSPWALAAEAAQVDAQSKSTEARQAGLGGSYI